MPDELETREIHAQIVLTWYKDGNLNAAWPAREDGTPDEIVTRYMLSKAEDAYNQFIRQQAMMEMMKQRPAVQIADENQVRGLNGKKRG